MGMLIRYLSYAFQLYQALMIIYVLSSWLPATRATGPIQFIGRIVEPYFSIFRRLIPNFGGMDFSPLIAFFVFDWVTREILLLLIRLALR